MLRYFINMNEQNYIHPMREVKLSSDFSKTQAITDPLMSKEAALQLLSSTGKNISCHYSEG